MRIFARQDVTIEDAPFKRGLRVDVSAWIEIGLEGDYAQAFTTLKPEDVVELRDELTRWLERR